MAIFVNLDIGREFCYTTLSKLFEEVVRGEVSKVKANQLAPIAKGAVKNIKVHGANLLGDGTK